MKNIKLATFSWFNSMRPKISHKYKTFTQSPWYTYQSNSNFNESSILLHLLVPKMLRNCIQMSFGQRWKAKPIPENVKTNRCNYSRRSLYSQLMCAWETERTWRALFNKGSYVYSCPNYYQNNGSKFVANVSSSRISQKTKDVLTKVERYKKNTARL